GGWRSASAEAMVGFSKKSSDALRERGWATVSVAYRYVTRDDVCLDDIISDCMDAGRYLAHFADELGIDPHRIVTSGHSAGGHLALMLAYAPHRAFVSDSPFDALADEFTVVATAPLSAPTILYNDEAGYYPDGFPFLDVFPKDLPEREFAAVRHRDGPFDYITPASVPTLLVCGTHDDLVFAENSTRFFEKCRTVGAPCQVLYSYFGGHCFEPMVEGRDSFVNFSQVQDHLIEFVQTFEA
ncbi:MAG: alpha/beta hydrolase, partial [Ruminococcaceae bacterium]|nr:alpha/beta hydrolase [Oscillospiraceae bacterium]